MQRKETKSERSGVETSDGPKSWNVRHKHFHESLVGQHVRLTSSPLLGYVTKIEPATEPSAA